MSLFKFHCAFVVNVSVSFEPVTATLFNGIAPVLSKTSYFTMGHFSDIIY